jgi:TetR/AcrR family transcriptional regulator, mexJK operon transcriptional repressor
MAWWLTVNTPARQGLDCFSFSNPSAQNADLPMPRPKPTGLPPEQEEQLRMDRLLDVAAEVFMEMGYQGASTAEIARRAQASKATFYARFANKEKLFLAVLRKRTDEVFQHHAAVYAIDAPIRDTLLNIAEVILGVVLSPRHLALLRIVQIESPRYPELGKTLYELGPGRSAKLLAAYLRDQTNLGTLRLQNPELAAEQFIDLVAGSPLRKALLGVDLNSPKSEQQYKVESAVDVFLRAYH